MLKESLVEMSRKGLYCRQGDFYIDPHQSVERAVITHAHSDHARKGSKSYLCAARGAGLLRARLGKKAPIESMPYTESVTIGGVRLSFHPAGHILGSAQVRLEYKGQVWVVSGDYKKTADPTCEPFEQLPCHCFITESTFGLPIYRWQKPETIAAEINEFWQQNKKEKRASVIYAYSLGKAQRVLSMLDSSIGPIFVHKSIDLINREYLASKVLLPASKSIEQARTSELSSALILTPPGSADSPVLSNIDCRHAFASGWARVAKNRAQGFDRSFVLSDHADWTELLEAIKNSNAERVIVMHGYTDSLVKHLNDNGINAGKFARLARDSGAPGVIKK